MHVLKCEHGLHKVYVKYERNCATTELQMGARLLLWSSDRMELWICVKGKWKAVCISTEVVYVLG